MFTKQKLIMLVLIVFCSCLSLNSHSKIEKVVASEVVWGEATTIVSGNAYLITAESGGVTYYLPTGTETKVTKLGKELNISDANIDLWTFNSHGEKYHINDEDGNILYAEGTSVSYRLLASNNVDSVAEADRRWTLDSNKLKSGTSALAWTIAYEHTNNKWFPRDNGRISSLKFYELTAYGKASSFSTWIMGKADGDIVTPQCSVKYSEAKVKWNALTSEEKDLFKTSVSLSDARRRLTNWATANGETIQEFYNNSVLEVKKEKSTNNGIVFALFSAILLVSGLIINKRIKVKE